MNVTEASHKWEISEKEVDKICREMGIDADNIPDETVPVYLPDRLYEENAHRYYIYLLDVISNTHMEIKGIDKDILETCIEQMKEKKLIVLKTGADKDSLDYHDYIMSADVEAYNGWYNSLVKDSMSFMDRIVSFFKG